MKKRPDPIDVLVGNNVRILRLEKGFSQSDLAERLGITFQQIQKYEKGINRIGSSRLARLSQVLGVSVSRFFQGSQAGTVAICHQKRSPTCSPNPMRSEC